LIRKIGFKMDFNNFKDLITNTRATRRFKSGVTISPKDLEEVIDVARVTSSAKNMQPLKYITVTDKNLVKKLSDTTQWAAHLKEWSQSEDEQPSAFIIVLNDTSIDGFAMLDCGISLNCIMTGLKIKGYASCPLASIDKKLCKDLFEIKTPLEPMLGIAVGIADETIKLVEPKEDTNYYRDEDGNHYVPKRSLNEVLVGSY
jgi:nitroreductase